MPLLIFTAAMTIFLLVCWLVSVTLRRKFNIEGKKKVFSYNHVNDTHRKIDWTYRIFSIIVYFILFYYFIFHELSINFLIIILAVFIFISEATRAYFEWRHSSNPKMSILTLSDLLLTLMMIIAVLHYGIFGLL